MAADTALLDLVTPTQGDLTGTWGNVVNNGITEYVDIAIAGTTTGLINKGETVTWRGKHFGVFLQHKSIISQMDLYSYFVDEQLKGHFKSFKHQHFFEEIDGQTIMKDVMEYEAPYSIFGKIFDFLLLTCKNIDY